MLYYYQQFTTWADTIVHLFPIKSSMGWQWQDLNSGCQSIGQRIGHLILIAGVNITLLLYHLDVVKCQKRTKSTFCKYIFVPWLVFKITAKSTKSWVTLTNKIFKTLLLNDVAFTYLIWGRPVHVLFNKRNPCQKFWINKVW